MKTVMQNRELSETEQAVAERLAAWGVKYTAIYTGEAKEDGWKHDAWVIVFASLKTQERFDFCTGTGLRRMTEFNKRELRRAAKMTEGRRRWLIDDLSQPVVPTSASVLYSLLLDSCAAKETFADWCSNYGCDADSIKALKTYDACCDVAKQLSKVFSRDQLAELQTLLEDY